MRHRALLLAALLAGMSAAACGPGAQLQTPPGFAVLGDQTEYIYRSTSAEGVVLAIRGEKNLPKGNLDFWADALDQKLQSNNYRPDGKATDVRAASGQPGRQMRYTREQQGRSSRFWVTVFVTDSKVWLIEVGGDRDHFKGKIEAAVAHAIETMSIG
jgi:hypothetical protein